MENVVAVWQETVMLPTYPIGKPEKNPIFLEKRVYQGSSGAVYPHAVIEQISDEKIDKAYTALFLENAFLKIMILPELGGRIHRAFDKIRKRDFVYYNQVIKPALVGLTGPWISGGIEFNWPQHHRPSTFLPVDYTIIENEDGSKTVWVNEVELMFRTKCQAGFTLYPDKAFLEVKGKLYNRTAFPQTFLWWANPAVKVNEYYQSVFPPDVHAVFDHGKRDVSDFPIAKGTYYNVDYSPGTDISRYANIPVPTSYMAIQSKFDFIGGYEHDSQAGMLHVANHHISPGKKQWTWGNGDFGKAWDRNLTDEDGPYIELMTGMFTDNQPDFSWLQPNEEKTFEQYFMPYAGVGLVKNATRDAMINVENSAEGIRVKVFGTAHYAGCSIQCLDAQNDMLISVRADLSPMAAFETVVDTNLPVQELTFRVLDAAGKCLVAFDPLPLSDAITPKPASPAKLPAAIDRLEDLFLTGLHLEQYRHATYQPMDYYMEALHRDPADMRCNNAVGLWLVRHGQFERAISFFQKAIETATQRNPNPYDGEAYFNLGINLSLLERFDEAYNAFYKATWNDAWQHNGFLQLAKIDIRKGDLLQALVHIDKSLIRNYHSHNARHLKAVILRKLNRHAEAIRVVDESLELDPFGYGCLFEGYLSSTTKCQHESAAAYWHRLEKLARGSANNYIEYAIDYGNAGCFEEACSLLELYVKQSDELYPLACYFLGYYAHKMGDNNASEKWLLAANECVSDYCFPNKLEELGVLSFAAAVRPSDAKAPYYLGNCWHGMRQYEEAIAAYERSIAIDPTFPIAHRNLALLYYNKHKNATLALQHLQKAFELNDSDARVCMELDNLYSKLNWPAKQRLSFLETHVELVAQRDDLYLERIWLLNCLGQFNLANDMLMHRKFHPWEGGEGKVIHQFLYCQIMLAMEAMQQDNLTQAYQLLMNTDEYPENLSEGKLFGTPENDIQYLKGRICRLLAKLDEANDWFKKATKGNATPTPALFYNDPQPDKILYQGLALRELGDLQSATTIFNELIAYGEKHINDEVQIDYFAVSLPDVLVFEKDLNKSNQVHCNYLIGLGLLGNRNFEAAAIHFQIVLDADACHLGVLRHFKLMEILQKELPQDCDPSVSTNERIVETKIDTAIS